MENEYLEKELKERGVDIDNTKEKVIELFESYLGDDICDVFSGYNNGDIDYIYIDKNDELWFDKNDFFNIYVDRYGTINDWLSEDEKTNIIKKYGYKYIDLEGNNLYTEDGLRRFFEEEKEEVEEDDYYFEYYKDFETYLDTYMNHSIFTIQ